MASQIWILFFLTSIGVCLPKNGKTLNRILKELNIEKQEALSETPDRQGRIMELDIAYPLPVEQNIDTKEKNCGKDTKAKGKDRQRRNADLFSSRYWPDSTVYYVLHSSHSTEEREIFEDAIREFEKYTCIRWKERTSEEKYVLVDRNETCWSYVGMVTNGINKMGLGQLCLQVRKYSFFKLRNNTRFYKIFSITRPVSVLSYDSKQIPIHEMCHTLGLYHEHTRPDRDTYVTVNTENIEAGALPGFARNNPEAVNLYNTSYSYESVLHYGKDYYTSNGLDTITAVDERYQEVMGTTPTLSFKDIQILSAMYNCNDECPTAHCPENAFQNHECTCYCKSDDPDNPVFICGTVCLQPNEECSCNERENACSAVHDTICNATTGACECRLGYVLHEGACVLIDSIQCEEFLKDCKCSLTSSSCTSLSHAQCNSSTDECECQNGWALVNQTCVDIFLYPCDGADKPCFCGLKGDGICAPLAHSSCNSTSHACECQVDYYNNTGVCSLAAVDHRLLDDCHMGRVDIAQPKAWFPYRLRDPGGNLAQKKLATLGSVASTLHSALSVRFRDNESLMGHNVFVALFEPVQPISSVCSTLNEDCKCSVQHSTACHSAVLHSICNIATNSCICDPSAYKEEDGKCVLSNHFVIDGRTVSPFYLSAQSTTNFHSVENIDYDSTSVSANGYYLHAAGNFWDRVSIESEMLQATGYWCLHFGVKLNNVQVKTEYSYDGIYWFSRTGIATSSAINFFYPRSWRWYNSRNLKFRITSSAYTMSSWSVSLDSLVLELC
ncbi:uncharacterized protein [Watersipora subatra]|uniref:uncharacterized protein n=1 Tax=Watersipora subatra TaxID=2589382 RepID=UPI00355B4D49